MPKPYPPELRAKVVAYAEQHGPAKASRKYNVKMTTVCTWQSRARGKESPKEASRFRRRKANLPAVAAEAGVEAPEVAPKADPLVLAEGCYGMVVQAQAKLASELGKDDPSPKLIHALCGAVKIGAEIGQLLSGKPTARNENLNTHVFDSASQIVANPEAREYARAAFRAIRGNGHSDPSRSVEAGCPN